MQKGLSQGLVMLGYKKYHQLKNDSPHLNRKKTFVLNTPGGTLAGVALPRRRPLWAAARTAPHL